MITQEEVKRLVGAYENVVLALDQKNPRRAAKILCKEFRILLDEDGSFWAGVRDATETLEKNRKYDREMLNNIKRLINKEGAVFAHLKIKASRSGPILDAVYGGLKLAATDDDPSPEALDALKRSLAQATDLICKEDKGLLGQACSWVLSLRGATVLAGAATAAANVVIAVHGELGVVSHLSVKAGVAVMRRDIGGIIDLLTPH